MAKVLKPYAESSVKRLNPYQLGHQLAGLNGMAFVFGTQANPYKAQTETSGYVPIYSATIVIAANRNGIAANVINGWRTLIDSDAVVLFPHNGTENGRLAAVAMALGLGAEKGDYSPALEALAYLNTHNRLNHQDEYGYDGYNYMYHPERLTEFDAIVLWDYQARMMFKYTDEWDIVVPEEGVFTVDCGFVYAGSSNTRQELIDLRAFLISDKGKKTLVESGFSPLAGEADLSVWERARLTYNPEFRRDVLSIKQFAPASLLERLLLNSFILVSFSIGAQRVLRRIPRGACYTASFCAVFFVALWLLIGLAKSMSIHYDTARYIWFATYIPRHFLPLCWYAMCYASRHDALPPRKSLIMMSGIALLFTAFVFSNDIHRQIFIYSYDNPATWGNHYGYGWGYGLSLCLSFSLSAAGLLHLVRKKMARRQKWQMLYAGLFFGVLAAYQTMYIAGVQALIDLDVPTTIALFILIFILAIQRTRFMGMFLLDLPVFSHSPYAISVYDNTGQPAYRNTAMIELKHENLNLHDLENEQSDRAEIGIRGRVYKQYRYTLNGAKALVLEDITSLKQTELELSQTQKKLYAVNRLLIRKREETRSLAGRLEQERYTRQMEQLFDTKLTAVRCGLNQIAKASSSDAVRLRRIRMLIYICQQRLRFIIRSMNGHPFLPAELITQYAAGVIKDGQHVGLDGVITAASHGSCPSGVAAALLEVIDCVCLYSFDMPGSSFICRFDSIETGNTFSINVSCDIRTYEERRPLLPERLVDMIIKLGGRVYQETEEDGMISRLYFPYAEVQI
ncbi:MAG: solute-binding protein [Clostridiales bacterium]|nr:solute-binding protein [Clostridiales bacterium]